MAGGKSWWRAWAESAHDPKLVELPGELFKHWYRLLCLRCVDASGATPRTAARWLGVRHAKRAGEILEELHRRHLLDLVDGRYFPHNWEKRQYLEGSSTERTRRSRERKRGTPPEQNRAEIKKEEEQTSNGRYAFEYGCVRLTEQHLGQWTEAYSHLDLKAEMIAMEPWARSQGKRWFQALSGLLAKRNREAKLAKEKRPFNYNGPEGVI